MSIYKMRTDFGHHFKWILGFIALVFVVGAVYQFGPKPPGREGEGEGQRTSIAVVNGMPITLEEYHAVLDPYAERARDQGVNSTLQFANIKAEVFTNMIEGRLLLAAAKKMGVDVSQSAVDERYEEKITDYLRANRAKVLEKMTREQDAGDPRDDSEYINKLTEYGTSLAAQEENARSVISRAGLEEEVAREGINEKLKLDVGRISGKNLADSYKVYKVRQILVSTAALPAAQAKNKAEKILNEAKSGKDFAALARQNSDDEMSKSKGGEADYSFDQLANQVSSAANIIAYQQLAQRGAVDQQAIARGQKILMDNPVMLSQAAKSLGGFYGVIGTSGEMLQIVKKLKPGEISKVIPTDRGFLIVKLESVQSATPDKKTAAARRDTMRQVETLLKWMEIDRDVRRTAQIRVEDPEMAGYYHFSLAQNMAMAGKRDDYNKELALAAKSFKRALTEMKSNSEAAVEYALILREQGNVKKAVEVLYPMLEGNSAAAQGGDLRLMLGDMLLQLKDPKDKDRALSQFKKASEEATYDRSVHVQLVQKYKQLGMPELAAEEEAFIAQFDQKMKAYEERQGSKTEKPAPTPEENKPGE